MPNRAPTAIMAPTDWPPDRVPPGTVSTADRDLDSLVTDFVDLIPIEGSGSYQHPTTVQASVLRTGVRHVLAGRPVLAARVLAPLDYRVLRVLESGRQLIVLAQISDAWSRERRRAWGLYAFAPGVPRALVEVPHPLADLDTEFVGLEVLQRGRAGALLVAGAHRLAVPGGLADVAHQPASAFQAVHEELLAAGASRVLQAHGFAGADTDCPFDAVVSSGVVRPAPVAHEVHQRLAAAGWRSHLFCGVPTCRRLGATTNVQGAAARRAGAQFVHLELTRGLRRQPARESVIEAALAVTDEA